MAEDQPLVGRFTDQFFSGNPFALEAGLMKTISRIPDGTLTVMIVSSVSLVSSASSVGTGFESSWSTVRLESVRCDRGIFRGLRMGYPFPQ
jgi:hypothetical protein